MLCSNCNATLIDGSQFCQNCGKPVNTPESNTALVVATAQLACRKCGASLPEGSEFCLKCGQPVNSASSSVALATAPSPVLERPTLARPPRRRRRGALWFFAVLLLGLAWVLISGDPIAQQIRDDVTGARAQAIVETPFSVKPHSFSYYEFTVPPGAVSVTVNGQFSARGRPEKGKGKDIDNNIEAYVLTDSAFVVWRNGYSTSSFYESGRVAQGTIYASLPAGGSIYYLVLNNNFSPRTEKTVDANVLLRYKTWAPEWLLRIKERFWDWLNLN